MVEVLMSGLERVGEEEVFLDCFFEDDFFLMGEKFLHGLIGRWRG